MREKSGIISELKRLDELSGMSSHTLPIKLSRTFTKLGSYTYSAVGNEFFQFSFLLLDETLYSEDAFLDTIRHEFCHYYCRHSYPIGKLAPHGSEWKNACIRFGAVPRASEPAPSLELMRRKMEYRKTFAKYVIKCPACGQEIYYFCKGTMIRRMMQNKKSVAGYCGICKTPLTGRDLTILLNVNQTR